MAAFLQVLAERGWIEGRNLRLHYRSGLAQIMREA